MASKQPLPPISEDSFDGEHQSAAVPKSIPRCAHSKVKFVNGSLECPQCGSGWQGPNLHDLYKHFTS